MNPASARAAAAGPPGRRGDCNLQGVAEATWRGQAMAARAAAGTQTQRCLPPATESEQFGT